MSIDVEIRNPMDGAAYQVLYEAHLPFRCFTRERQAQILAEFEIVRQWASGQPRQVAKSYNWAIGMLTKQLERQVGTHEMGDKVNAAKAVIPLPPGHQLREVPGATPLGAAVPLPPTPIP